MNNVDPRGPGARRHRSSPDTGSEQGRKLAAPRIIRWLSLLPVLLALAAVVGAVRPDEAASPTTPHLSDEVVGSRLPLHVNRRVEKWVDRFRTDQRANFQRLLKRRGLYADIIRQRLRRRDMPEELLYMAMMESGLSPWAVSRASAVGVWQFMGPTAVQYGLRVDAWVDERKDPVRATDAALDYLEWLHDRYDSWYLAAAAYNAGPGRVDRVLRRHAQGRTGQEELYWEVINHLPRETREYVPRLVAATLLAEDPAQYGFDVEVDAPYSYDRVFVPGGTSLARVAESLDLAPRLLRDLNPHLIRGVTPPGEAYPVRVPVGASPTVVASLAGAGGTRTADDD